MLETGQSIDPHTHRRANDTLSRFTFFTWFSRQSWKSSLPLTERQARAEHSHGRLWHRKVIKYSHSKLKLQGFFGGLFFFLEEHQD